VLRNSVVGATTQIGLLFGGLISSAVAVEAIFDWPGVGSYAVSAILTSDYKAVLAVTLVVGLIYSVVNILVAVVHAWRDPRVAKSSEGSDADPQEVPARRSGGDRIWASSCCCAWSRSLRR